MYIREFLLIWILKKMSLQELLKISGMSKDQLIDLLEQPEETDLAQLRKNAGFDTQSKIVEAIKQAFAENGIDNRTMTQKNWSEYERGLATPFLSLKGWLILCKLLKCTPEELANAMDVVNKNAKQAGDN